MTVEELIAQLQKLDPKALVILSGDAEGNDYSGLAELDIVYVEPDYEGGYLEGVLTDFDFDDRLGDDDESVYGEKSAYKKVVALWPV